MYEKVTSTSSMKGNIKICMKGNIKICVKGNIKSYNASYV